ncbi:uncharacterized protein BJX67DRAFT_379835 [Aspergillus lucknowensis]|uniref:Threonylcarbamoyl-AMP synthase n=1 Tax=Aspergillus lucknowensis TaxID=176173 RepID=A0ABR4LWI3_9EURO
MSELPPPPPPPPNFPNLKTDPSTVLTALLNNGTAIIPTSLGYGIIGCTPSALARINAAKNRPPHKRQALIGSFALHRALHVLPASSSSSSSSSPSPSHADLIEMITETQGLPLGVVAPYNPDHDLLKGVAGEILDGCTSDDGTMAILVGGGPFQEELVRLATERGVLVWGSSANLSGHGTKTRVEDIEGEVLGAADVVVDYGVRVFGSATGSIGGRASSTMIDFSAGAGKLKVVRFGACYEGIRDVLGRFGGRLGEDLPVDPGREREGKSTLINSLANLLPTMGLLIIPVLVIHIVVAPLPRTPSSSLRNNKRFTLPSWNNIADGAQLIVNECPKSVMFDKVAGELDHYDQ